MSSGIYPNPVARWIRGALYRLTTLVAGAVAGVILFTSCCEVSPGDSLWQRALWLFAYDPTVRKTAVVCGVGLWLTAVIFFRPRYDDVRWVRGYAPWPDKDGWS
jgi:hypothetical protein